MAYKDGFEAFGRTDELYCLHHIVPKIVAVFSEMSAGNLAANYFLSISWVTSAHFGSVPSSSATSHQLCISVCFKFPMGELSP